jgi:hypothetical protein
MASPEDVLRWMKHRLQCDKLPVIHYSDTRSLSSHTLKCWWLEDEDNLSYAVQCVPCQLPGKYQRDGFCWMMSKQEDSNLLQQVPAQAPADYLDDDTPRTQKPTEDGVKQKEFEKQPTEQEKFVTDLQNTIVAQASEIHELCGSVCKLSKVLETLMSKEKENIESITCFVCMDQPRNMCNLPCGHVTSCSNCSRKNSKKCMVCRSDITSISKIYI